MREKDDSGYVIEHYRRVQRAARGFDGVAYAMRLLRFLDPPLLSVYVRRSARELQTEGGRAWGRAPGERWASIAIPPSATRMDIVTAILAVTGRDNEPLLLEVLLRLPEPD